MNELTTQEKLAILTSAVNTVYDLENNENYKEKVKAILSDDYD